MRILVADDEPVIRMILARALTQWGHEVVTAEDGDQAWSLYEREPFRMVITDWMMPGLDGIDLTRRIRSAPDSGYTYMVLLTARTGTASLVEGMDAGADDFMVKPFQVDELRARVRAGERVLQLESDLAERGRRLGHALDSARQDLEAAADLQRTLLPLKGREWPAVRSSWRLHPANLVAGDVFGVHALGERFTAFYLLDVAGHGVSSAMMSFSLSKMLSPEGLLLRASADGRAMPVPPAEVLADLNVRFQADVDSMKYFTILYGLIDAETDQVTLAQGGHPSPLLVRGDRLTRLGESGFPIGMLPGLSFDEETHPFAPGDRLYLYSDGVTECPNEARQPFRTDRLEEAVRSGAAQGLEEAVVTIEHALEAWRGDARYPDDVTLLALERKAA